MTKQALALPFLVKLSLALFSIITLGYLVILGNTILAPLFFSMLLSLVLLPLAGFLELRWKFSRSLAAIVSVVLMICVLSGVLYFFATQLAQLWQDWPLLKSQVTRSFHELQEWISATFEVDAKKQLAYINDTAEKALTTTAAVAGTTLLTLSSTFLFLGFTLLFTFFILNYRRVLYNFLTTVFRKEHSGTVAAIVTQIQVIIKKYLTGLLVQMLIVSILMVAVLSVLGVKYALLLGLVSGIFNVIPYLGILFALLISVLITFATAGAAKVLLVIIAFVAVHAVDGNILMPLVVGSKVKINALFAFIGIILGEMIWGISGMFLCIPFLAILKIIFDHVEPLRPWGLLLGEDQKPNRKRRAYRITKKIKLEEQE